MYMLSLIELGADFSKFIEAECLIGVPALFIEQMFYHVPLLRKWW
jgi:hypothetical protein